MYFNSGKGCRLVNDAIILRKKKKSLCGKSCIDGVRVPLAILPKNGQLTKNRVGPARNPR